MNRIAQAWRTLSRKTWVPATANKASWLVGTRWSPISWQFWNPNGGAFAGALLGVVCMGLTYINPWVIPATLAYIFVAAFINTHT